MRSGPPTSRSPTPSPFTSGRDSSVRPKQYVPRCFHGLRAASVFDLLAGIMLWLSVCALWFKPFLEPLLGTPTSKDGTFTAEQVDRAQTELVEQPWGPFVLVAPQLVFLVVALVLAFLSRVSVK